MNKDRQYQTLRSTYGEFIYDNYEYSISGGMLKMIFHFEIPGLAQFKPKWSVPIINDTKIIDSDVLDTLVFSLGMVELVSYWKSACPPVVRICCGFLDAEQTQWWKKLYFKGLGEFFYTNGIKPDDDFMTLQGVGMKKITVAEKKGGGCCSDIIPKVLVPVGGGKDSVVTLELLSKAAERFCYIINPRQATTDTVRIAGLDDKTIIAHRSIDSALLKLNGQGFLNGHTPFSAIVAFSSVIAAYINGLDYVTLSNESSANESTVADTDINHQYSKSYEFECDFNGYEKKYISSGVNYFSFLRPLTELKIAQLFSGFKQYHEIFRSCNAGSKTDDWCGCCPKCLFVYIILSPFLEAAELYDIFQKDMLNDIGMSDIFDKLTGFQPEKPFECVGSRSEVNAALRLTAEKYRKSGAEFPSLLRYYCEKIGKKMYNKSELTELFNRETVFNKSNSLPPYFLTVMKNALQRER